MKSYQQITDYGCGPAVIRTVLSRYKLPVPSERALIKEMHSTDARGTLPKQMVKALRARGLTATIRTRRKPRDVIHLLKRGHCAIIDWSDWGGHYVLALEYAPYKRWAGGMFFFADPAASYEDRPDGYTSVAGDRLRDMWHDASVKGLMIEISN